MRAWIHATTELGEALGLPQAEELVRIERLRSLRGAPIGLQTILIPHRLCPGYLNLALNAKASSLEIIRHEYHLSVANIAQVVKAGLSSPREMKCLKISHPVPVLILERKSLLDTGAVVELRKSTYLADCFQLLLTLDLSHWPFRVGGNGQYKGQHQESR